MNQEPSLSSDTTGGKWFLSAHIALVIVTCCIAGFTVRACAGIGSAETLINEKLGGIPLPQVTQWVLQYRAAYMLFAVFVPCAAVATLALRDRASAMGVLAALMILTIVEALFIQMALQVALRPPVVRRMTPA